MGEAVCELVDELVLGTGSALDDAEGFIDADDVVDPVFEVVAGRQPHRSIKAQVKGCVGFEQAIGLGVVFQVELAQPVDNGEAGEVDRVTVRRGVTAIAHHRSDQFGG